MAKSARSTVVDWREGTPVHTPLRPQNVFNFMFFFFRKFGIIIYVGFPTGGLALLPNRNPGSALALDNNLKASHKIIGR